ncbi:hypothetical protein EHQ59_05075 [Leptospira kemamanensis]|uniref:Uncharacterized protein n=1 Tax=Leptospira kemamanensis TaxID=2484942 RepID=A0A4R9JR66_9LEPT|nr:hypothetical protein [Leptospira kemamanensis]TGL54984.1 hypothetical protein EHQ59_05075 [Leptospira kemamanensis]
MTWFFWQKKKKRTNLEPDVICRIEEESKKLGKDQVLFVSFKQNKNGRGDVLVGFQEKSETDHGYVRYESEEVESKLKNGQFQLHDGKLYFYPNVDIEWLPTSKKEIHKIVSNYEFAKEELYLEAIDFFSLLPELNLLFQKEKVLSLFMKGTVCQLELKELDEEKEKRISESLLTYLSSFYPSPVSTPRNHL